LNTARLGEILTAIRAHPPFRRRHRFVQSAGHSTLSEAPPNAGILLEPRTYLYDNRIVNGREFVARARKYAKSRGLAFEFDASRGKGSHGILKIGGRKTTVEFGEIPKGTFHGMLRQLRIRRKDF